MSDRTEDTPDAAAVQQSSEPVTAEPLPRAIRVGWVAGPTTLAEYGRALQPLAIGLMDELVEITALCPEGADAQELPSPPAEMIPYGRVRWWRFHAGQVDTLAAEVRRRKLDLLHALDADAWPLTAKLAELAGLNAIVSAWGLGDTRKLGHLRGPAATVLAASRPIRDKLLARRTAAAERILLVRPGVYQGRQATCFPDPDYRVSIVAGGCLDDFATFAAVIRSFAGLRAGEHNCVFFILGNGRAEKQLRSLAETLGIRSELTFVDRQPPRLLPEIFKAADIYVSPVPSRAIDMASLLAMAGGVPVLAAARGASDFLIDGQTVTTFARGDAADLTTKLSAMLADHSAACEQAERALAHLRANHSPAGAVTAVTRAYRQVAAMPTPSPALQSS